MKDATKQEGHEPTITEVMGAIHDLTEAVQTGFAKVDERLERVDERLDLHDKLLKTLVLGQENLQEQLNDNTNRLIKTQNRVEDIADTLEIDHEPRLVRLEKARA